MNEAMMIDLSAIVNRKGPLVKICGLQTLQAAEIAIDSGSDLVGMICVPNRKRTVNPDVARNISALAKNSRRIGNGSVYVVGVFRNQTKEEVLKISDLYDIDIVQLHGDEDWKEYYEYIKKPIIKRFIFPRDCDAVSSICTTDDSAICLPLFDSEAGGTGELLDWESISNWAKNSDKPVKFLLAGGLTPDNVSSASSLPGVVGVDVSGGVETDGEKDSTKISKFIHSAKT
ncbi:hypothetical protein Kpol_1045p67 [Vanderwaltozyma polyspora DSM 70294]|uniref:N-(5'-phosphoribosyl)anthranilate isomerase n=1 Tax=Vanderwaltozyma polyspora (strain ATCC 22028 / DSM 70294 / BCRC 21397 / CBS 2163 / NBRC 10782 / NRRL Y-8283 / UCD 57-17) TaxID=436907 RepID=A7TI73_VANPO|nr:uncharacterized protein Kpol_1045p67 [Vanderwaltozyma polyspora DSM 70294]EDO18080.1 hypothetical protein Kpol_1045p67 [Vanderwaltozyma polyspora DSM 70294]